MREHFDRYTKGLTKLGKAQMRVAWDEWCEARNDFSVNTTRSRYNRMLAAGQEVVKVQDALGVWLIHPVNARPGLSEFDVRIIDDLAGEGP